MLGRWQRAATFFKLQPANPYYPSPIEPLAVRSAPRRTEDVRRRFAAPEDRFSRTVLVEPRAPFPGPAAGKFQPPAQLINAYLLPVSPFVVVQHCGTTRNAPTSLDCLAENTARPSRRFRGRADRLLLRPHSQTPAFKVPWRPTKAPGGPTPAARVLPALAIAFVERITSLSRVTGRDLRGMVGPSEPSQFPAAVAADFGGPNVEASPYPPTEIFRCLAASFVRLTGKPSRAFHG